MNQVRIIAGQWRSRKLEFPDVPGLRPTPDRVRETLFNWLSPTIIGAHCLDLYAGTGVLGFEALSRGASSVVSVDNNAEVVKCITAQAQKLGTGSMQVVRDDALHFLQSSRLCQAETPFDIVFLDPPFAIDSYDPVYQALSESSCLHDGSVIYIESPEAVEQSSLPQGWIINKSRRAGQVYYHLVQC
jgi:16S rRNA (guanine966-N2)-methyltransferase